jgi:P-type Ca2+ transporter type 2C
MDSYKFDIEKIIQHFKTDLEKGLNKSDANSRLKKYGQNRLPLKTSTSFFKIFYSQFLSPLMLILLVAAIASILINEKTDAIVIFIAIAINAIVGLIQEWNAECAARALKSYEVPSCNVRRDGKVISIEAKNLVPGDIVLLSSGNLIPADIRLTYVVNFSTGEALLTGEAKPIKKIVETIEQDSVVGDRKNMAFAGTHVVSGKAEGIVVATAQETSIGQIVSLIIKTQETLTPLQYQIKRFSWILASMMIAITIAISIIALARGMNFHEVIAISIALAVAAIPEGLVVAVTVILAIGMRRMLERKALVRNLVAAETLGSVSVICTDKTGTLTEGKMKVVRIITKYHDKRIEGKGAFEEKDIQTILSLLILNNDAEEQTTMKISGTTTEIALLEAAKNAGIDVDQKRKSFPRISEIPFSSEEKFMATVHNIEGKQTLLVKGAPEKIFSLCQESDEINRFKTVSCQMAGSGLRTLAAAVKKSDNIDLSADLNNLTFMGLIGIQDPLRPQAEQTVNDLKSAGIKVVVVTGDHKHTAASIANSVGISSDGAELTGQELNQLSENQMLEEIQQTNVFSRVEPKHKINIVKLLKKQGEAVAMIGDGVNDAPALKAADIGIALGSGSDVAHEISDMVLLDNNLSTVFAAVREGRVIFDNIRKVIVYLMADSFSEVVLIGAALIFGLPIPLLAAQILWINLITDGFPYIALTVEPGEPGIMQEKPRSKYEPVVNNQMKTLIFIIGIVTDIGLFALFYVLLQNKMFDMQHIRTIMFTALAIDSLFYVFSVRSIRQSMFRVNPFKNKWIIISVMAGVLVQIAVVYIPSLQKLFSTVSLGWFEWGIISGLAMVKIVAIELTKEVFKFFRSAENLNAS